MTKETDRIVRRFKAGVVVPFKPKPGVPTETIGGRRYNLSTDGGPLGDSEDPSSSLLGEDGSGGARLVHLKPIDNKWRFLWVYDTDHKYVAMFRVTDGNEKVGGSDKHFAVKIPRLEAKGQLNRVTHSEFEAVEHEMRRREHVLVEHLQESIEQSKSEFQRTVDKLAHEYFEKVVVPKLERAIEGLHKGAIPLGFKPFGPGEHDEKERLRQALSYTVGQVFRQELTEPKIEAYVKHHGIDPLNPNEDSQAIYWAIGDIQDEAYARFLPPR